MIDPADKPPAPPAPQPPAPAAPATPAPAPTDDERQRGRLEGLVPDIVRRAVVAGVGALFMTEEGIRNLVSEVKLPREAMGYLLEQAQKTRSELARVVTEEVRRFLESEKLSREVWKILSKLSLEIRAEVRLKPSDDAMPNIKTRVKVNSSEDEK